ncbi:L,D-transpeptidase [Streptomyces sp. NPDC058751]|uniref:L,D-transpeptidase n=1 Tax=Streptomyces sp. NPDC058751 TaxID=3346623 RepID=UPI0036C0A7C6
MSDELATALRALATEAEKPPVLSGAEIRGRASGRRRRRRTALAAAGVSIAGALALVVVAGLGGGAQQKTPPAASSTAAPSPSVAKPDATIDLGRRVISVAGHELTLHGDTLTGDAPTVRMTVAAKAADMRISSKTVGFGGGYVLRASWVVELTGPDGRADYVGGLPSRGLRVSDAGHGWIVLDVADAKLLYERLELGAVVEIRPSAGASASSTAPRGTATAGSDAATGPAAGSGTSGSGTSGG